MGRTVFQIANNFNSNKLVLGIVGSLAPSILEIWICKTNSRVSMNMQSTWAMEIVLMLLRIIQTIPTILCRMGKSIQWVEEFQFQLSSLKGAITPNWLLIKAKRSCEVSSLRLISITIKWAIRSSRSPYQRLRETVDTTNLSSKRKATRVRDLAKTKTTQ